LIAHGTGDDNRVHFANTLSLVDDLIAKGKSVGSDPFLAGTRKVSDPRARSTDEESDEVFVDNLMPPRIERGCRGQHNKTWKKAIPMAKGAVGMTCCQFLWYH